MSQEKSFDAVMERIRLGRLTALQKTRRWCEGDRGGRHNEEVGGEDHGKANCQEGGESHSTVPVRLDHKSRLRVCRPHSANHHGQG